MDLETFLVATIAGAVGGAFSAFWNKALDRRANKLFGEAEAARDLAIQLASSLNGLEGLLAPVFDDLDLATLPKAKLVDTWSGFEVQSTPLKLESLLLAFSNHEVHRCLILYYGRLELFSKTCADHREAFYWLLDSPDDASDISTRERREVMVAARRHLRTYVRDLLQYGHELLDRILPETESLSATVIRGEAVEYTQFLDRTYGITKETARLKRAYYASRPTIRCGPPESYALVIWNDHVAEALGGKRARLCASLEGESRPREIPAYVEVALPRRLRLTNVMGMRVSDEKWLVLLPELERDLHRNGVNELTLPADVLASLKRAERAGAVAPREHV